MDRNEKSMSNETIDFSTDEVRATVPPLYSTEDEADPMVRAKFFAPWCGWTWYAVEFDGDDLCFGLVAGIETELGYFRLSELSSVRGPGGLRIERDLYFQPTRLSIVRMETERSG